MDLLIHQFGSFQKTKTKNARVIFIIISIPNDDELELIIRSTTSDRFANEVSFKEFIQSLFKLTILPQE